MPLAPSSPGRRASGTLLAELTEALRSLLRENGGACLMARADAGLELASKL
ncbi:hypothetical protein AAFG13_37185 [Bradyrhizobium sp. B124]|uniref:hypothetical protein n=1 Tax=Bradyrhizobium sp. B124 TaxID=3140245 RepID=UPI00318444C6